MSTKVGRKKTKKNVTAKEAANGAEPTSPSEPTAVSSPAKAPVSVGASQTGLSQGQGSANINGAENNDLETLRRLKETILNGQHPFFKATPQVAHLQALRVTGQTYSHNGIQAYRATSVPGQDNEDVPPQSPYAPYGQHEPPFQIERDNDIHVTGQSLSQEVAPNDDAPHAPETRDEQMADSSDSVPTGPVLGDSSTTDIKPQGGPDRFPERGRYYDGRRSPRADHGAGRDNWEHRQNRPAYSDGRYRDYDGVNRSVSSGGVRRQYQDRFGGPPNDRDSYPDSRAYDYNRDRRREPPTQYADDRRPGEYYNPKSGSQRPYDNGRPGYFPPPPPRPDLAVEDDRRTDIYRRDDPRPVPAPVDVKSLVSAPPTDSVAAVISASTQEKPQGTEPSTTPDDLKGDPGPPNSETTPARSASADVVRPPFRGPSPGRSDTRDSGRFGGPDMRGPPQRNTSRGNAAGSRIDRDYRPHDDMRSSYIPPRDYPEPSPRLDSDPRYPPPIPGGPLYERTAPPPHVRDDPRPPYDLPRDRDYRDTYTRSSYPPPPDDRRYVRDPGPPLAPPPFVDDPRYPLPPKEFGRPPDIDRRRDLDRGERVYDRERGYNNRERDMRPPPLDIRGPPPPLPLGALPPRSAYVPDRDRDVGGRAPLSARISPRGSDQFAPPPPPDSRGGYERPGYGGPPPPGGAFPQRDNPRVRPRSLSPARRDYRPDDRPPMKRPRPDEPYPSRPLPPPAAGYGPPPSSYAPPPPRPHDPSYPPDRRPAPPPPGGPPPPVYYNREPPRY